MFSTQGIDIAIYLWIVRTAEFFRWNFKNKKKKEKKTSKYFTIKDCCSGTNHSISFCLDQLVSNSNFARKSYASNSFHPGLYVSKSKLQVLGGFFMTLITCINGYLVSTSFNKWEIHIGGDITTYVILV